MKTKPAFSVSVADLNGYYSVSGRSGERVSKSVEKGSSVILRCHYRADVDNFLYFVIA